ncbi:zinc finger BED domain-containing protein DAYSLEEPER [Capsicum annuum]|uniref:zinc finger BED domain-containing protein DAYSLEEPER n=1 Tax=Capsicum annuum TaxID=4072 RepID=UPI0007BF16FC|nr:zinc finger BED domain-containing protein DAYSLEEPER [Capsicum annuum]XP_016548529.1 zinc finger BED domain-containing protein DAYSLEEPER [Capsicum annuum]
MQVWKIECLLKENLSSFDKVIKEMAARMFKKFQKYWNRFSLVLSFGASLDLRFKTQLLEFCFSKVDASLAKENVATIEKKMHKLYEQYENNQIGTEIASTVQCKPIEEGRQSKQKKFTLFAEFKEFESTSICNAGKSELTLYLEEQKLDYESFQEMDVIKYWKDNEKKYPNLSVMARDVLSIPITLVASESAFSIGGRVVTKYRSCIHHENVQTLVTTRNWLHGFTQSNTDEDVLLKEPMSNVDSNVIDGTSANVDSNVIDGTSASESGVDKL